MNVDAHLIYEAYVTEAMNRRAFISKLFAAAAAAATGPALVNLLDPTTKTPLQLYSIQMNDSGAITAFSAVRPDDQYIRGFLADALHRFKHPLATMGDRAILAGGGPGEWWIFAYDKPGIKSFYTLPGALPSATTSLPAATVQTLHQSLPQAVKTAWTNVEWRQNLLDEYIHDEVSGPTRIRKLKQSYEKLTKEKLPPNIQQELQTAQAEAHQHDIDSEANRLENLEDDSHVNKAASNVASDPFKTWIQRKMPYHFHDNPGERQEGDIRGVGESTIS